MNSETITLNQIAEPTYKGANNVAITFSLNATNTTTFSISPFLYYAMKAMAIHQLGYRSESDAFKAGKNIKDFTVSQLRELARTHRVDITLGKVVFVTKRNRPCTSVYIQEEIFTRLINFEQQTIKITSNWQLPAKSIYVIRANKTLTIPYFLYGYIKDEFFQSEKSANLFISDQMINLRNTLKLSNALGEDGALLNEFSSTSWTRKLHHHLYRELIVLNHNEIDGKINELLDVVMYRDLNLEQDKSSTD